MIRCVISDMGKVILHFDRGIFYEKIAGFCPYSKDKVKELTLQNFDIVVSFNEGAISPEEFYRKVISKLKAKIGYDEFYAIYSDVFFLNSPVLDIMKRLKRRYKLILLSNTDVMHFTFIKKKFPEILIFDDYILSYEVGAMKPDPRIYEEALKRTGFKPEECLFIDDMEENIKSAQKLGIKVILMEPRTDLEAVLRGMDLSF
jgi:epoxide hydrolase-like predicted phosphatase